MLNCPTSNDDDDWVPVLTPARVSGDEILSINGQVLQGMTHGQAISVFKNIRQGAVSLHIARRLHPQLPPFGKRLVCNIYFWCGSTSNVHVSMNWFQIITRILFSGNFKVNHVRSSRSWRSKNWTQHILVTGDTMCASEWKNQQKLWYKTRC